MAPNITEKRAYQLSREINYTYDLHINENNFYDSIIIAKTVRNATLKFSRYGIERKIGDILQCKRRITKTYQNCYVSVCSKFS